MQGIYLEERGEERRLYCAVLYCAVLYCNVAHCAAPYCTVVKYTDCTVLQKCSDVAKEQTCTDALLCLGVQRSAEAEPTEEEAEAVEDD